MKKLIQITAGRGPVECSRAVTLVARELCKAIPGLKLVDSEPHNTVDGCFMSMTFSSDSEVAADVISQWEGTVLWRATENPYRPHHRRNNWFVGVHFIDPVTLPEIKETDIVYETCRSGGKGGQNVNKVETTVRATHLPTGTSVRCSDERSQQQNKSLARLRLLLKLRQFSEGIEAAAKASNWSNHDSLQRGNPVQTFSGPL